MKTLTNNQTEILELKNSVKKMKNTLENIEIRADHVEERINELKDNYLEMTQVREVRESRSKKEQIL